MTPDRCPHCQSRDVHDDDIQCGPEYAYILLGMYCRGCDKHYTARFEPVGVTTQVVRFEVGE